MKKLEGERAADEEKKQKARTIADSLLKLLDARGIGVDDEARDRIQKTEKSDQLEKWLVRAATAESIEKVFDGD